MRSGTWGALLRRPDFRRNPFQAIAKRIWWRVRWALRRDPWLLRLEDGSPITVHNNRGPGALVYFQHTNEPETASFLKAYLQSGMVFIDVGANIGEFTIRAARLVGASGEVHSFEPSPETFGVLQRNVELNQINNVTANCCALLEADRTVPFCIQKDSALSSLRPPIEAAGESGRVVSVQGLRLDSYWRNRRRIDLIKVDVEGAELAVLKGAELLSCSPTWIFEYSPGNYAHFGYGTQQIISAFKDNGYDIWSWDGSRCTAWESAFQDSADLNLIAAPSGVHPLSGSRRATVLS